MPCSDGLITDVITIGPDITVAEALDILEKNHIRTAPVVDEAGKLLGMFGTSNLLKSLLPVSVTMQDGLGNLDFVVGATPGVAKRLRKAMPLKVREVMNANPHVGYPEKSIWESIRLLFKHGSPLPVVDQFSAEFKGLLTEQGTIDMLKRVIEEIEAEEKTEKE